MGRWRYDPDKDEAKIGKMRRRKQSRQQTAGVKDPFEQPEKKWPKIPDAVTGRVVEVHKRYCFVSPEGEQQMIDTGEVYLATLARRYLTSKKSERNFVAVGDRVLLRPVGKEEARVETDLPQAVIEQRAPRTAKIVRLDPTNPAQEHVLAANMDQLIIVVSYLKPEVRFGLIDRFLVLSEEQHLEASIVFNKEDLFEKEASPRFRSKVEEMMALYRDLGYRVLSLSALDLEGSEPETAVAELLKDRISLVSGHSGVGKSSFINLFDPEIVQEVEEDPDIFYKGRHTTSYASLIKIRTPKGFIIDSPGVRSFLLGDRDAISLTHAFREFRPFGGQCRYRECRHLDEPECAIKKALNDGLIHPLRFRSYKQLLLQASEREGRGGLVEEDPEQWIGEEE